MTTYDDGARRRCDLIGPRPVCGSLWCRCSDEDHGVARLRTTVPGTTMAQGIEEYAFDADGFCAEVERMQAAGELPPVVCRLWRPFDDGRCHWLLRSLVFVHIVVN